ncbi:MAG TPA: hypothetical protein VMQ78_09110 [Candidatus Limnocylindria bacterium]|nr:hypothetical protein [Candidatus Limnocylindria bacterium]
MMRRFLIPVVLVLAAATAVSAQDSEQTPPRPDQGRREPVSRLFESWLRGQMLLFGNFFQATEGGEEEGVAVLLAEVGTSVRLTRSGPLRAYGSVNYLRYDDEALDSSRGFRLGVRSAGRPHAFDVYYDRQLDRPTFDVGDVFDRADIDRIAGEYSNRLTRAWQVTVDVERERQRFDLSPGRDNDFLAAGAAVRYRGWRALSPEIGYRAGEREVEDARQSYDQRDLYLQLRGAAGPSIYWSARYRDRTREYLTADIASSNFGRADDRHQIAGYVDITLRDRLVLNLYGAWEEVDSNLPRRDFDTTLFAAGLTYRF